MDIFNMVLEYFGGTLGKVELAGTVASAICVYLAVKQNIWTWFWGAIGVALFGYLFYAYQLYSDAGLQILFYLPCQVVGFWWWKNKGPKIGESMPVKVLSSAVVFSCLSAIALLTVINGYFMDNHTDASFPYVDALTTWMSVFAQVLMIKKIWESWILWIAMDAIAINVYWMKGLYVTSGLYMLFFVLATMGAIAWWKSMDKEEKSKYIM